MPRWAFALQSMTPNPFTGGPLEIRFTMPESGPVVVRLVDLTGRAVMFHEGSFPAGEGSLVLLPGARMSPGIYFVQLSQGGVRAVRKVSVLR